MLFETLGANTAAETTPTGAVWPHGWGTGAIGLDSGHNPTFGYGTSLWVISPYHAIAAIHTLATWPDKAYVRYLGVDYPVIATTLCKNDVLVVEINHSTPFSSWIPMWQGPFTELDAHAVTQSRRLGGFPLMVIGGGVGGYGVVSIGRHDEFARPFLAPAKRWAYWPGHGVMSRQPTLAEIAGAQSNGVTVGPNILLPTSFCTPGGTDRNIVAGTAIADSGGAVYLKESGIWYLAALLNGGESYIVPGYPTPSQFFSVAPLTARGIAMASEPLLASIVALYSAQPAPSTPVTEPFPVSRTRLGPLRYDSTSIDMAWDDNSTDETGFKVLTSTDLRTWTQAGLAAADATGKRITGLTPGATYGVSVVSTNSWGDGISENGAQLFVTLLPGTLNTPAAPSGLGTSLNAFDRVHLVWADGSGDETGFKVERDSGSGFVQIATTNADVGSYEDLTVAASTAYSYRVRAYNDAGNSGYSNVLAVTTPATPVPPDPPVAPSELQASRLEQHVVDLVWTDNSDDEDRFVVERDDGGGYADLATVVADVSVYTDDSVEPGTEYTYRIRAENEFGATYSDPITVTTLPEEPPPLPPDPPTNVRLGAPVLTLVGVFWSPSTSLNVLEYVIQRSEDGITWSEVGTAETIPPYSYLDFTLVPNTTYHYRVLSRSAVGDSVSSNVVLLTAPPAASVPDAPTDLTAISSNTEIALTWVDNATTETGYRVQRSTDGLTYGDMVTLSAGATTWTDTSPVVGTTYYYRVFAVNGSGNSAYSNVVAAAIGYPDVTVTLSPETASVEVKKNLTITATVTGPEFGEWTAEVTWSVNGVVGGNATVGTVDVGGVYEAPETVPDPATVTVRATSVSNPDVYAEMVVTITAAPEPDETSPTDPNLQFCGHMEEIWNGAATTRTDRWVAADYNDRVLFATPSAPALFWPASGRARPIPGLVDNSGWDGVMVFDDHVLLWRGPLLKWSDRGDFAKWIPVGVTAASGRGVLQADAVQAPTGTNNMLLRMTDVSGDFVAEQFVRVVSYETDITKISYDYYRVVSVGLATVQTSRSIKRTQAVAAGETKKIFLAHPTTWIDWTAGGYLVVDGEVTPLRVVDRSRKVEGESTYQLSAASSTIPNVGGAITLQFGRIPSSFLSKDIVSIGPKEDAGQDLYQLTVPPSFQTVATRLGIGDRIPGTVFTTNSYVTFQDWVEVENTSDNPASVPGEAVVAIQPSLLVEPLGLSGGTLSGVTLPAGAVVETIDANESGEVVNVGSSINGDILGIVDLQEFAYILKKQSIQSIQSVGITNGVFFLRPEIVDEGPVGKYAWTRAGERAIVFWGSKGIFQYLGGQNIVQVAPQHWESMRDEADWARVDEIVAYHETRENHVWFVYPTVDGKTKVFIWHYQENTVVLDVYPDEMGAVTAVGRVEWELAPTWESLDTTELITSEQKRWNQYVDLGLRDYTLVAIAESAGNPDFGEDEDTNFPRLLLHGRKFSTFSGDDCVPDGTQSLAETPDFDFGDPKAWKYVDTLYVSLVQQPDVPANAVLDVQIGARDNLQSPIRWSEARSLKLSVVGPQPTKINITASGRYLRVRFSSSLPGANWAVSGYHLVGRRGGTY